MGKRGAVCDGEGRPRGDGNRARAVGQGSAREGRIGVDRDRTSITQCRDTDCARAANPGIDIEARAGEIVDSARAAQDRGIAGRGGQRHRAAVIQGARDHDLRNAGGATFHLERAARLVGHRAAKGHHVTGPVPDPDGRTGCVGQVSTHRPIARVHAAVERQCPRAADRRTRRVVIRKLNQDGRRGRGVDVNAHRPTGSDNPRS